MNNQRNILALLFFIMLWQAVAITLNSSVFPSAIDIFKSLYFHINEGDLINHLTITLQRVFIAFFIAMIIGVFFGILMGVSKKVDDFFDPMLIFGLNIPALVTIVISYIWFGLTDFAAIFAVIINKVPIIIVNIREGTKSIDKKYIELATVYKVTKKEILIKVFFPQLFPYLLATTRLSLSLIWKIVLVVELLGRGDGVGFKISMFFQFFDITSILAYALAFVIVIFIIEKYVLKALEMRINVWK